MPQNAALVQVRLQPEIDGKRADAFRNNLAKLRNILEKKSQNDIWINFKNNKLWKFLSVG